LHSNHTAEKIVLSYLVFHTEHNRYYCRTANANISTSTFPNCCQRSR